MLKLQARREATYMPNNNDISFEKAMQRIEEIVAILENGKSSLDESLSLFEEATKLCSYCNQRLDDAQKKVQKYSIVNIEFEEQKND